jgi:hypothetical protein
MRLTEEEPLVIFSGEAEKKLHSDLTGRTGDEARSHLSDGDLE